MEFVSILGREFPAVLDFRRSLVLGALGERVELDELRASSPPAGVV
jgi:hypothetical protein